MKSLFSITLFCLITLVSAAKANHCTDDPQIIKFTSTINNQQYELHISLPGSYSDSTKQYSVVYVLDGQWSLPYMLGVNGGLFYDGLIPELIIVGITWPGDYEKNRNRDFSPVPTDEIPGSGGAPLFLQVLKNEIIPKINHKLHTRPDNNCLVGGSFSGLFTLYTMLHEPSLFKGYIAGSPNINYANNVMLTFEKAFAKTHRELQVKLFISSGEYEDQTGYDKELKTFVDQLKASQYKGLEIGQITVEQMGHASEGPYGHSRGLQFVYGMEEAKIDIMLLDLYVGRYSMMGDTFDVAKSGDHLFVVDKKAKIKLYARGNDGFYAKGLPGTGQFRRDKTGKVDAYIVTIGTDKLVAMKIK